jgi:hypothetical protein
MVLTERVSIFSQCLHFSTLMVTNLVRLCWFVSGGGEVIGLPLSLTTWCFVQLESDT